MENRIKFIKKIYNNSSDPEEILDNSQNLVKIEFDQMILMNIITYLLIITKFDKFHLQIFSRLAFLKFEKKSRIQPNSKFGFKYFGVLEVASERESTLNHNEKIEVAFPAALLPSSSIMLTKISCYA